MPPITSRPTWMRGPRRGRGGGRAVRRPEAVADEVAWLKAQYAPDHLWFADDVFGLRPGWVEEYAEAVRAKGAALPFRCQSRADLLGQRAVDALRRAGCRTVWLGA